MYSFVSGFSPCYVCKIGPCCLTWLWFVHFRCFFMCIYLCLSIPLEMHIEFFLVWDQYEECCHEHACACFLVTVYTFLLVCIWEWNCWATQFSGSRDCHRGFVNLYSQQWCVSSDCFTFSQYLLYFSQLGKCVYWILQTNEGEHLKKLLILFFILQHNEIEKVGQWKDSSKGLYSSFLSGTAFLFLHAIKFISCGIFFLLIWWEMQLKSY